MWLILLLPIKLNRVPMRWHKLSRSPNSSAQLYIKLKIFQIRVKSQILTTPGTVIRNKWVTHLGFGLSNGSCLKGLHLYDLPIQLQVHSRHSLIFFWCSEPVKGFEQFEQVCFILGHKAVM